MYFDLMKLFGNYDCLAPDDIIVVYYDSTCKESNVHRIRLQEEVRCNPVF